MKILAPAVVLIGLAWPASASPLGPMFTVVDLGSGYQLQANSTGTAYSVTGANGGPAYAFDKSPTTSIDQQYNADGVGEFPYLHEGGVLLYTLQNGTLKEGYIHDQISGTSSYPTAPLSIPITDSWHDELMPPLADMNSHGEIVGTSVIGPTSYYGEPTYAAFSGPNGLTHDINNTSSVVDNLNNYIASSLGVNLTQGLKIDDLGRIIAQGTVGGQTQDFLLVPAGLSSSPIPAPEPSTLIILAIASVGWVVRRNSRR